MRADDAARVDRLVERFDLSVVDTASLRTQSVKEPDKENPEAEKSVVDQNMMDDILKKIQVNEEEVKDGVSNNFLSKESPSEHFSETKKGEMGENRESVREKLRKIIQQEKINSIQKSQEKNKNKNKNKIKNQKKKVEVKKHGRNR